MEDYTCEYLFIRMKDPDDHDAIKSLAKELKAATDYEATLTYQKAESTDQVKKIIDYVFAVTIAIMMFLCFFSLSASMSANLYD